METCETCRYVKTFTPRTDERERFGFGDLGYGCRYPGYEGYTKADSACTAYALRGEYSPTPTGSKETGE